MRKAGGGTHTSNIPVFRAASFLLPRRVSARLEELVTVPKAVRMHWTGCPNSCGQAQCGDIGLMGAPARKEIDGKKVAVPGVNIFVGGKVR